MSEITTKQKNFLFASLAVLVLLSGAMIVPTLSAYADHDNGNGKSHDNKKPHKKDRKGDGTKDPERCKHGSSAKYNKHCFD